MSEAAWTVVDRLSTLDGIAQVEIFGERRYEATDPEGHRWHFAERYDDIVARGGRTPEPADPPFVPPSREKFPGAGNEPSGPVLVGMWL